MLPRSPLTRRPPQITDQATRQPKTKEHTIRTNNSRQRPPRPSALPAARSSPPPRCHGPDLRRGSRTPVEGEAEEAHPAPIVGGCRVQELHRAPSPPPPPPGRRPRQPVKEGLLTTSKGRHRRTPHDAKSETPPRAAGCHSDKRNALSARERPTTDRLGRKFVVTVVEVLPPRGRCQGG
jgi:hypothetical protein